MAQLITVKGSVTDQQTKKIISGVSVKIGQYGTSTDSEGKYVILVQKDVVQQHGVTFSSVGYKKGTVAFADKDLNIALVPSSTALNEVVISVKTESIINKAIRKIRENYPIKDFILTGNLQIVNSAKDSITDTYFYKSDAMMRLYYPGYTNKKSPDVSLIHKKDTLAFDPNNKPALRWVSGYTGIAYKDFVHSKNELLTPNTTKFKFVVNGKDWINNTRVYVINFFSTQKVGDAGTIYIDTASYAFVKITVTNYNIKQSFVIGIDKSTSVIDYKKQGGKWYLDATETNIITHYNKFDVFKTLKFKSSAIELNDVQPFSYADILPNMMEDVKIQNPKGLSAPASTSISTIPFATVTIPKIEASEPPKSFIKNKNRFMEAFRSFVTNDNLRGAVGLSSLPFSIDGDQPALGRSVSPLSNYGFYSSTQIRLIQKSQLFLQLEGMRNYGIGGLKNYESSYSLIYNIQLNKSGHPITLSPSFGISDIRLSKKGTEWYKQKSFVYGLNLNYEISPRVIWYVSGKYYDPTRTVNNGLLIETHPVTVGTGLIFKLKI